MKTEEKRVKIAEEKWAFEDWLDSVPLTRKQRNEIERIVDRLIAINQL